MVKRHNLYLSFSIKLHILDIVKDIFTSDFLTNHLYLLFCFPDVSWVVLICELLSFQYFGISLLLDKGPFRSLYIPGLLTRIISANCFFFFAPSKIRLTKVFPSGYFVWFLLSSIICSFISVYNCLFLTIIFISDVSDLRPSFQKHYFSNAD